MRRIESSLRYQLLTLIIGVGLAALCGIERVGAEDGSSKEPTTVRKTEERLHFQLPPDWPIERRGGMTGPIPVEEYLAQKFSALESRLQAIEQRFNGFDIRLRVLEEQAKKQSQAQQPSGAP